MQQLRITKYNPCQRNAQGHYLLNEWTEFSDIGKEFEKGVLTTEQYENVESKYIESALGFLTEAGIGYLRARSVENHQNFSDAPAEGERIATADLKAAFRNVLRNKYWCKFEAEHGFVHFGYDFYMYIGTSVDCEAAQKSAVLRGLFVEQFNSPYLE